jgi:hypothetical protein
VNRMLKALVLASPFWLGSCAIIIRSSSVSEVEPPSDAATPTRVETAMKAFLLDGSMVVYPAGAEISRDSIVGPGTRYSLGLVDTVATRSVPVDSLVGIEAFDAEVNGGASFLVSAMMTTFVAVGTAGLLKAIFGSCPTFYASPEQGGALQAEAFSYSIAPLLEGRDLDVTELVAGDDGVLRMELRNEALETHYINHLELLAVDHLPGMRVLADDREGPIGVVDEVAPVTARDRSGRAVLNALEEADDRVFGSASERIRSATGEDDHDWIVLTFPRPEADTAVVTLRLRNSLLTTVLFYDMMLGRAGARAVDWIGRDMTRIGTVVELGRWFQEAMGMKVEVFDGTAWRTAGRVPDTGPIAWEDVGVRVAVPEGEDSLSVRLSFFTDAWRIDRVSLGTMASLSGARRVPVSRMSVGSRIADPEVLERLASPDDEYLVTYPGTSARLEFDLPTLEEGLERTVLLSTQGYYTEWVRRDWIRSAERSTMFRPGAETVETLMALWTEKKDAFEAEFHDSRIPVR